MSKELTLGIMENMEMLAKRISKTPFAPKGMAGNEDACFVAMVYGAELGLSPIQAITGTMVVNGRPSLYGDTLLAVITAHPEFVDLDEETISGDPKTKGSEDDNRGVRVTLKRKDRSPVVEEFTVADAKRAGLWGKEGPWTQYPIRMLKWRARGFAIRDAFPDVLKGFIMREEIEDYPQAEPVTVSGETTIVEEVETETPIQRFTAILDTAKDQGKLTDTEVEDALKAFELPEAQVNPLAYIDSVEKFLMVEEEFEGIVTEEVKDLQQDLPV